MAYIEGTLPEIDYRIILMGAVGHRPLVEDLPEKTHYLFTESVFDDPSVLFDVLSGKNMQSVATDGKSTNSNPLEDLTTYAKTREIPLIAPESLLTSDGLELIDAIANPIYSFKIGTFALFLASKKISQLDQPGEIRSSSPRGIALATYTNIVEPKHPVARVRNLSLAQKPFAFIEQNLPPQSEKPHATFVVGPKHANLRKDLALSVDQRVRQLRELSDPIKAHYQVDNFHLGFGVIFDSSRNEWRNITFQDRRLADIVK